MSSMMMGDVLLSSSPSSGTSQVMNPPHKFFDDKVFCFEPDIIGDDVISPLSTLPTFYQTLLPTDLTGLEGESEFPVLHFRQVTGDSAEACPQTLKAKSDDLMSGYFSQLYGNNLRAPTIPLDLLPRDFKRQLVPAEAFGIDLGDRNYQSSAESSSSTPSSESQQPSSTTSVGSSSPKEIIVESPKSEDRPSLSRSQAFRAAYRCDYGSCTFEPSGKRAYHKRTLARHQEKCIHSPLPRERKPCKCNFPGCNKGFSRSDGLNAHRRTTGHGLKIELQVMQEDYTGSG